MPAGSVSSTVVIPLVGAVPEFVTVKFQVPFVPAVKLPLCVFVSPRLGTGAAFTTVGSDARSFAAFASPIVLTLAAFVTPGTAAAPTAAVRLNEAFPLAAMEPGKIAVTTWPMELKLHPAPEPETNVIPAGSVSRTVVIPLVAAAPPLFTAIVHAPFVPAVKLPACDFAIERSGVGAGVTVVGSVSRSFAVTVSDTAWTTAAFVTPGSARAPTATVSVNGEFAPTAIEFDRNALTTCPLELKLHPEPLPETNVIPVGSVSSTVVIPVTGPVPTFVTVMVQLALLPTTKVPECVFEIAASGNVATGVVIAS